MNNTNALRPKSGAKMRTFERPIAKNTSINGSLGNQPIPVPAIVISVEIARGRKRTARPPNPKTLVSRHWKR
jgi:hypothetical protein